MKRPRLARSGVSVRPIAVAADQKRDGLCGSRCRRARPRRGRSAWFPTGLPSGCRSRARRPRGAPTIRSSTPVTMALTRMTPASAPSSIAPVVDQCADVDPHADGDQENAEGEALERLDHDLDFVAIVGLGDDQPGDQRADDGRQAGRGSDRWPTGSPPAARWRGTARASSVRAAWANSAGRMKRPTTRIARIDHQRPADARSDPARWPPCRPRRSRTASVPAPDPRTAASPAPRGRPGSACRRSAAPARSTTSPAPAPATARRSMLSLRPAGQRRSVPPSPAARRRRCRTPSCRIATRRRKLQFQADGEQQEDDARTRRRARSLRDR